MNLVAVMDTAITDSCMYCEVLLPVKEIKLFAAEIADLLVLQNLHLHAYKIHVLYVIK